MQLQEFIDKTPETLFLSNHKYLIERIVSKLLKLQNIVLTAYRGWGKSALIKEVSLRLIKEMKDVRILNFDMQGIFEKSAFLQSLLEESCKALSMRMPDKACITPKKGFEILNHIESKAKKQGVKLIVFLSNFGQIGRFGMGFQEFRLLQSVLLKQKNCAFCFSCNNHVIVAELFGKGGSPMSRFGRIFYLKRSQNDYEHYVKALFFYNGKDIEHSAAKQIIQLTVNHLYYVRLLSWNAYLRSAHVCNNQNAESAFLDLIKQFQVYLQNQLASLTKKQYNFMCALAEGQEQMCSEKVLSAYKLGSSSNVARIRMNLSAKGLIEVQRKYVTIIDPLLEHYLLLRVRSRR